MGTETADIRITVTQELKDRDKALKKHSEYGNALAAAIQVCDDAMEGNTVLSYVMRVFLTDVYLQGYDAGARVPRAYERS